MAIIRSKDLGSFISLTDTPDSYAGQSGKFVRVNVSENGLDFTTSAASPVWNKEIISISAGITESSSEIVGASFVKYFILAEGNSNAYAFEMNVFNASGNALDSISNKIGSMAISVISQIGIQGPYIEITNNELYNITVTITYMGN